MHALTAANRPGRPSGARPRLLIAGATGALGDEVLRRLVGGQRYGPAVVLAREAMTTGLRGVHMHCVPQSPPSEWVPLVADIGIVLFEPPRLFHDRERALWTPQPAELVALARWMRRGGAHTLAVVLPHAQGRLPEALKRGLANLDEEAIAGLGFERLLILRSAQKPAAAASAGALQALADWMLSITRFMVPASEQPVRAASVAELLAVALACAPPGIHIAAPEVVWQASQGRVTQVVRQWLGVGEGGCSGLA
jgi:hypothetical protein